MIFVLSNIEICMIKYEINLEKSTIIPIFQICRNTSQSVVNKLITCQFMNYHSTNIIACFYQIRNPNVILIDLFDEKLFTKNIFSLHCRYQFFHFLYLLFL